MTPWIYAGLAIFAVLLFFPLVRSWWRKPKPTRPAPATVKLAVTDFDLTVEDTWRQAVAKVAWTDVSRITLITTADGPWSDDRFYHVIHTGGELTIPSHAAHAEAFTAHLQTLPDFSAAAFSAALNSTQNNAFAIIYARTPPLGGGA